MWRGIGKGAGADQLDDQAVRIFQPDNRSAEFVSRAFRADAESQRPRQPEADRSGIDRHGNFQRLAVPDTALAAIFPDEKCQKRAG
ncbi:hypothetical protein D3C86_1028280 [compost metagenome]